MSAGAPAVVALESPSVVTEAYQEWVPVAGLPRWLILEALWQNGLGLHVRLCSAGPEAASVVIVFASPIAYRNIDESYRLRTWQKLAETTTERSSLQVVTDSRWVQWLRDEAGGVLDDVVLHHYAILTDCDCVDVVTSVPPEVSYG